MRFPTAPGRSAVLVLLLALVAACAASTLTITRLSTEEGDGGSVTAVAPDGTESAGEAQTDTIRRVLAELPDPEPELANVASLSKAELDALLVRVWNRRQAQLQEALNSLTDDAEAMRKLLDRLLHADTVSSDDVVSALEDLEYHVANLDNAADFAHVRGAPSRCPCCVHAFAFTAHLFAPTVDLPPAVCVRRWAASQRWSP